jgi:hypothetical protein
VLGLKRVLIISAIVAAALLLLAAVALLIVWRASQSVPDFYASLVSVDPAEQRSASDTMVQKATLLAGDVQKSGKWEALFTEQEINGWLAVDLVENHGDSLPSEIIDPRVAVESGGLRIACQTRQFGIKTVMSIALDVYLAEPNVVGIRVRHARAGAVPLPLAGVLDQIRDLGDRQGFLIRWQQADGDPVALVGIRPVVQGDKPVVIESLDLAQGEIYVSGTTDKPSEPDK